MYPFKTKAQGGLISEQETVSSETKASKNSTASDPDAQGNRRRSKPLAEYADPVY
jgi:hypothetical protein